MCSNPWSPQRVRHNLATEQQQQSCQFHEVQSDTVLYGYHLGHAENMEPGILYHFYLLQSEASLSHYAPLNHAILYFSKTVYVIPSE